MGKKMRRGKEVNTHECQDSRVLIDMARVSSNDHREHGVAIDYIYFNDKDSQWVATNDEYATAINFCPFCGEKLQTEPSRARIMVWEDYV